MNIDALPKRPLSTDEVRELRFDGLDIYSVAMYKSDRYHEVAALDIRVGGDDHVLVFDDMRWKAIHSDRTDPSRVVEIVQEWIDHREAGHITPIAPEPWSGDRE